MYDRTIDVVIIGLVLIMVVVLIFAFLEVFTNLLHLIPDLRAKQVDETEFRDLVANVLDVFVVIELFSTFTNYIRTRHVRISILLDVSIVFALRELLVKLYAASSSMEKLIGLCLIVIILVIARSIANRFSPQHGAAELARPASRDH